MIAAVLAHARLLLDIFSMKIFVWIFGRNGELLDSHLFFFDRYSDLADYHRQKGRIAKADRLAAIAEMHFQAAPGDDDDPPEKVAAMAMPVPQRRTSTNAVSITRVKKPSREPSSLVRLPGGLRVPRLNRRSPKVTTELVDRLREDFP